MRLQIERLRLLARAAGQMHTDKPWRLWIHAERDRTTVQPCRCVTIIDRPASWAAGVAGGVMVDPPARIGPVEFGRLGGLGDGALPARARPRHAGGSGSREAGNGWSSGGESAR